jgi:hypothetical protein
MRLLARQTQVATAQAFEFYEAHTPLEVEAKLDLVEADAWVPRNFIDNDIVDENIGSWILIWVPTEPEPLSTIKLWISTRYSRHSWVRSLWKEMRHIKKSSYNWMTFKDNLREMDHKIDKIVGKDEDRNGEGRSILNHRCLLRWHSLVRLTNFSCYFYLLFGFIVIKVWRLSPHLRVASKIILDIS